MNKHAYVIICHNNFNILKLLISALDDPRNDIYIHVDRKVRQFPFEEIQKIAKFSSVTFVNRLRVKWGGYSQIKTELILLKEATKTEHSFYHLLSGVDFPIKTQDEIHRFFEERRDHNFVDIDPVQDQVMIEKRTKEYHFLQDHIGRNRGKHIAFFSLLEACSLTVQRKIGIDRVKKFSMYKGSSWFSITHEFACYLLQKEPEVQHRFRFTICADELFLQTILMCSPYAESNITGATREIDWKRGSPYTFRMEDLKILMDSRKLFARKFDEKVDWEIVADLFSRIR